MLEDLQKQAELQITDSSFRKEIIASTFKVPSNLIIPTLEYRHEIKYVVSESKAQTLERFLEPYLRLDRYCKLHASHEYPVVSLYLDSRQLQLCRESLEGRKNRFKLRIRSYTDDPYYPRFFEIKRRVNNIIIKDRGQVKNHHLSGFITGLSFPHQDYITDGEVLKQFRLYMSSIGAKPVIKVRYTRRAYEGKFDNSVRITFDRQLAFEVSNAPEVSFNCQGWQSFPVQGVILEIKFTGHYPAWLGRMIKCFDLQQQSLSKYARSIKRSCLFKFCAPKIPVKMH